MAQNILKKDTLVYILSGKDKGKKGKVVKLYSKQNKVVVEGVNKVIKHVKPNPQLNIAGGRVEIEKPMHISKVAVAR